MDAKTVNRFMSKVAVNEGSGCWEWTGAKKKTGYGFFFNGTQGYAHRFSFTYFIGEIVKGNFVCHKCDNPSCVNPYHLFQGTQEDNMQDSLRKGRFRNQDGIRNHSAKLNKDSVLLIRGLFKRHRRCGDFLCRWLGVSPAVISFVKHGKSWRHI